MAAPIVYKSTDASAPTLNGSKGSLITVLKACLVNGYGAKAAAGWSIALEDAPNYKIIFRNDTVDGSGRYFRIQDNGKTLSSQSDEIPSAASLVGMRSYVDIDTPTQPFPRVIAGGNLHSATSYGVVIPKCRNATNPSYAKPWMVIADKRTCYLWTTASSLNSTALPTATTGYDPIRGFVGFGDIKSFNPSNSSVAKAFVLGGYLEASRAGTLETEFDYMGYFVASGGNDRVYIDTSLETPSRSAKGLSRGAYFAPFNSWYHGVSCLSGTGDGSAMRYPSPLNVGTVMQPIVCCEETNESIRTYRWGGGYNAEMGVFPGVYGCPHTTAVGYTYRIGDELSTVVDGSKSYLIYSVWKDGVYTSTSHCMAFDLGDWWT